MRGRLHAPTQFLLALKEAPQLTASSCPSSSREGFDLLLHGGQFLFRATAAQDRQAALGFFPRRRGGGFKRDFEQEPAIAVLQSRGQIGRIWAGARCAGVDQYTKDAFAFQAVVQFFGADFLRQLRSKLFRLDKHLHKSPLRGFSHAADKFRASLHLAAALARSLAH
jgi:hypothetical protein